MSVKAAKQERVQALAEIERLQQRVADLDAYIRVHDTLSAGAGARSTKKRDSAVKQAIVHAIEGVLGSGAFPMKTPLIVDALKALGVQIPGQDPVAYVSQLMSREKKKFTASRKDGWSLPSAKVVRIADGGSI